MHAYPVIPVRESCKDYRVFLNGREVELNTARVSAVPFNRRWPGHQREIGQSELVNFLSACLDREDCLEGAEPVELRIVPCSPFDPSAVRIRPRELGLRSEITEKEIRIFLDRAAQFTVEPWGRSHALHVFVDPFEELSFSEKEEVIRFGPGEHDVGMICLKSNQTLFLEEGAVVYGCVRAMDAKNIRIVGRGILDNSRNVETIHFECNAEANSEAINNATRLHTVQLEYCEGVEINGITVRDSLVYNIRPIACKAMSIRNVKIIGCWRYNSDGIDMHNCEDVHISDCFIRTFDDSICVKGFDCYYKGDVEKAVHDAMYRNGKSYDVFRAICVENCTIWNDWGRCLEIGAETRAEEICDVVFRNCHVIHVSAAVLDCQNVDYAHVHDVVYENIDVEYDDVIPHPSIQKRDGEKYVNTDPEYAPPLICAKVRFHHEYSAKGTRRGKNSGLIFRNIRLYGNKPPKLTFSGYDAEHKTEDVLVEELYLNGERVTDEALLTCGEFTENIRLV